MTKSKQKYILVTGDCVCNHNFYKGNRYTANSLHPRGFRIVERCGGALFLKELIARTINDMPDWQTTFGISPDFKKLPSNYHAFCLWEPQVANPWKENLKEQFEVWRAAESSLGYGHPGDNTTVGICGNTCGETIRNHNTLNQAVPEIVVIDDAGLGFQKASPRTQWPFSPESKKQQEPQWVVMKLTGMIGKGDLWTEVIARCKNNLILIISAEQLRLADVRISRGLSWEATAEDVVSELNSNPALQPLLCARHLVVTFRTDGAFWLDNDKTKSSLLVFDAEHAEGEWSEKQGKGTTFGSMSCCVAAVVRELSRTESGRPPDFEAALIAGLSAGRELRRIGHGKVKIKVKQTDSSETEVDNPDPGFPFTKITEEIQNPSDTFVSTPVSPHPINRGNWMMLDEWQDHARTQAQQRPHYEVALAVSVLGANSLGRLPVARFGGLQTVDRKEIENLRTIRQLILNYESIRQQKQPLNIGVFGPPGAGKSFGVSQIAKAVLGKKVSISTFNLSQFNGANEIIGALHQVRDMVLSGTTPVVFWDEFDSKNYEWLQYLLAPMQDGVFQDGPITHPIGKCIFVFAGATSQTYEAFGPLNPDQLPPSLFDTLSSEQKIKMETDWSNFVLKKGPDFKSRLAGYLNVLGPNPKQICNEAGGRRQWTNDPDDRCCPIRRALFIRAQFKLKDGQPLRLDTGVLRALLEVPQYKAGARSLAFLCQYLQRRTPGAPSRSCLPGQQLLDMHVDAIKFWEICERDLPFLPMGTELASALHEGYRLRIKGCPDKTNLDVLLEQLPPDVQKANVAQALRIPENLRLLNLHLVPGPKLSIKDLVNARTPQDESMHKLLLKNRELLAEAEHNGWMVERMLNGWTYARILNNRNKKHPLLIPYKQLSEEDKNYDRESIIGKVAENGNPQEEQFGYVDIVKLAGFRVKAQTDAASRTQEPDDHG